MMANRSPTVVRGPVPLPYIARINTNIERLLGLYPWKHPAMNLALYPHLLARYEPQRPAIVVPRGEAVTYGEFEAIARGVAHRLRGAGLGRGDVCALSIRDDIRHLAAIFAIWRLGAILLPL